MLLISLAFKFSGKLDSSKTTPMFSLIESISVLLSLPRIFMVPPSRLIKSKINFIVVVFPAPFSPIKWNTH